MSQYDPDLDDPEDDTTGVETGDEEADLPEESEAEIDDYEEAPDG